MRQIGYLGLALLVILALTIPSFAQANDGDAYRTFYNAQPGPQKIDLGEKFLNDFKDSQYRQGVYQQILQMYVQAQNWAKVMETADKLPTALPNADAAHKSQFYQFGLAAAQQLNNPNKVIDFGEKVLAAEPNNLNAQVMVSSTLLVQLPAADPAKKTALDKAADLATKGLTNVQQTFSGPKPAAYTDAQWSQAKGQYEDQLHSTLGLVYFTRNDWPKSTEEYTTVLKSDPKDGAAHFYLGLIYRSQTVDSSQQYAAALKAENDAKAAKPIDQPLVDELGAKTQGLVEEIRTRRDKAIDELATAVAFGGVVAQQARPVLETLYKQKNNDSVEGLDQLINSKK